MSTARAIFQAHVDGVPGSAGLSLPLLLQWILDASMSLGRFEFYNLVADTDQAFGSSFLNVIIPPTTNTVPIRLKGATGDTGVQLHGTTPTILALPSGGSFILRAVGGAVTGVRIVNL